MDYYSIWLRDADRLSDDDFSPQRAKILKGLLCVFVWAAKNSEYIDLTQEFMVKSCVSCALWDKWFLTPTCGEKHILAQPTRKNISCARWVGQRGVRAWLVELEVWSVQASCSSSLGHNLARLVAKSSPCPVWRHLKCIP